MNRNIKKIFRKIKTVKNDLPPTMPFKPSEFLDRARFQDRAVLGDYAVAWAVQWLFEMEERHDYCDDVEKTYMASPNVFQEDLCDSLAGIGVNNDVSYLKAYCRQSTNTTCVQLPSYITQEHFTRPETQALLKDIEVVPPAKKVDGVEWMDRQAAVDRIVNSDLSLSAVLENLAI